MRTIFVITRKEPDFYDDIGATSIVGATTTEQDARALISNHVCPTDSDARTFTYHGPASYTIHETQLTEEEAR